MYGDDIMGLLGAGELEVIGVDEMGRRIVRRRRGPGQPQIIMVPGPAAPPPGRRGDDDDVEGDDLGDDIRRQRCPVVVHEFSPKRVNPGRDVRERGSTVRRDDR